MPFDQSGKFRNNNTHSKREFCFKKKDGEIVTVKHNVATSMYKNPGFEYLGECISEAYQEVVITRKAIPTVKEVLVEKLDGSKVVERIERVEMQDIPITFNRANVTINPDVTPFDGIAFKNGVIHDKQDLNFSSLNSVNTDDFNGNR